jgi:hypothetical protein
MATEQPSYLMWESEMPLLNNRFFLYGMAKLLLWTGLICGVIFGAIAIPAGGVKALGSMVAILGLILFGLLFLFVMISLVFFGNSYRVKYLLAAPGIGWESMGRRGKVANRLALVAGALSGSPSVAGAGLLAAASESGLLGWESVARIKAYPALSVISVMNSWRVVTRLYCTPQYYAYAVQWLRWGAPRARFQEYGAPVPAVMTPGKSGSLSVELFRRAALLAGACTCLWLAFWTPPLLIKVERADFAKEYERKYGERKGPRFGAIEMGREFLRQNTNPGSVEAFALQTTENRLLKASGQRWAELYQRVEREPLFFHPQDPSIAELLPQVERVYARGTWLVSYLPVPSVGSLAYLQVWYENRPRETKATGTLVYPRRGEAWLWLGGGLLLYFLLPWPARQAASLTQDRASMTIVDLLAAVFTSFFFALPLYAVHFTQEVLGDEIGITIFCWCLALSGVGMLMWAARVVTRPASTGIG